jgi:hypothetical protein
MTSRWIRERDGLRCGYEPPVRSGDAAAPVGSKPSFPSDRNEGPKIIAVAVELADDERWPRTCRKAVFIGAYLVQGAAPRSDAVSRPVILSGSFGIFRTVASQRSAVGSPSR